MSILTAKIVAFLTPYQVILNKGTNEGIVVGMKFGIKMIIPDVVDPEDPSNKLSGIFYEKGEVEITWAAPNMSFAKVHISFTGMMQATADSMAYLGIDGKPLIDDKMWKIRVGDEVFLKEDKKDESIEGGL